MTRTQRCQMLCETRHQRSGIGQGKRTVGRRRQLAPALGSRYRQSPRAAQRALRAAAQLCVRPCDAARVLSFAQGGLSQLCSVIAASMRLPEHALKTKGGRGVAFGVLRKFLGVGESSYRELSAFSDRKKVRLEVLERSSQAEHSAGSSEAQPRLARARVRFPAAGAMPVGLDFPERKRRGRTLRGVTENRELAHSSPSIEQARNRH